MASLSDGLLRSARAAAIFAPRAELQALLDVEAALARAQSRLGVIPPAASEAIARHADAAAYDVASLGEATTAAGNPAIPMVRALRTAVGQDDPEAAGYVHLGATSQDVIDTARMLQLRRLLAELDATLVGVVTPLRDWASRYRQTPMVARTLGQHALPTTFGWKAAGWLTAVRGARRRLRELASRLPVQLGGAAGTRAAFGGRGAELADALADELKLSAARPWHTDRTPIAEAGSGLGLLVGSLGKLAGDAVSMMRTEIGELHERAPEGGSSALPHKRNPVALLAVIAAARLQPGYVANLLATLPQEHERASGEWHAEWLALEDVCTCAAAAAEQSAVALARIDVDPERMRANLDATGGLVMSEAVVARLAAALGHAEGRRRVEDAVARAGHDGLAFREALSADPAVAGALGDLDAVLDPTTWLGETGALVDAVLDEDDDR